MPEKTKYKNPERYIKSLQTKLQQAEDNITQAYDEVEELGEKVAQLTKDAYGKRCFTWDDATHHVTSLFKSQVEMLKVGSEVCITGRVIRSQNSEVGRERLAEFKLETVYVKD